FQICDRQSKPRKYPKKPGSCQSRRSIYCGNRLVMFVLSKSEIKKHNGCLCIYICIYCTKQNYDAIMHSTVALLFAFFNMITLVQQSEPEVEANSWKTYGYVVLGGIVLVIAVVVLVRKQHRKFNE